MRNSKLLRICDVREVDRIVFECLERWHDPTLWQSHLLAEMKRLLNYPVVLHCELNTLTPDRNVKLLSATEYGWPDEKLRRLFSRGVRADGNRTMFDVSLMDRRFRKAFDGLATLTCERADLICDSDWRDSPSYVLAHHPAEMDEMLYSAIRLPGRDSISLIALGGRDVPRGGRQPAMLELLHHQIVGHLSTRLATHSEIGPHWLSAKQREVFSLLLTGLDEKSIAKQLFRSRSTVNGHIAAIYSAFQVSSRAELMAYHLTRRPLSTGRAPTAAAYDLTRPKAAT